MQGNQSLLIEIAHAHRTEWLASQPFVLGLLGDYSGRRRDELPTVRDRRLHDITLDTLDCVMASIVPVARIQVTVFGSPVDIEIEFHALAHFEPDSVMHRVPLLAAWAAALPAEGPLRETRMRDLMQVLNDVLHAEPLRRVEASWRSVHQLLTQLPDGPTMRVRLFDLSKDELVRTKTRYRGTAWDQSPLFNLFYRDTVDTWGGEPFSVVVGDYEFSHLRQDPRSLEDMARISAVAGCIFVTSAAPRLLGLTSFRQAASLREISGLFEASSYAAWRSLRDNSDSANLALALPRVLVRSPHRQPLTSLGGQLFDEDVSDPGKLPWAHASYLLGLRLFVDFALRAGVSGLPNAPTGGISPVDDLVPLTGDALDGRFDSAVSNALDASGLVVMRQTMGSAHVHYAAGRSLASGPADYLAWHLMSGRISQGLRDLARVLRGCAWAAKDYEASLQTWLQGLSESSEMHSDAAWTALPLKTAALRAAFGDRHYAPFSQSLAVEIGLSMHPLRPGREEHCASRASFVIDGGPA